MKKILLFIFAAIISCLSFSQTKTEALSFIKRDLAMSQKQLPIDAGGLILSKIGIVDNCLISNFIIDENRLNFLEIYESLKQNKHTTIQLGFGSNKEFADNFVKSGLDYKIVISGNLSKGQKEVFLSNSEIANDIKTNSDPIEIIKNTLNQQKSILPQKMGSGLTLVDIYIEGNYVCYKVQTDGSVLTIPLLKKSKEKGTEFEESLAKGLKQSAASGNAFINLIKSYGLGIKYIYTDKNNKDSVTFSLTSNMIQSII